MTEPPSLLTPVEVARFLMGLSRRLDELVEEYGRLGEAEATAKRIAAVAEARAYIDAKRDGEKRTVDELRAMVVLATSEERFAADLAGVQVTKCREALRAIHARLDTGRTLSATSRMEMQMAGGPG